MATKAPRPDSRTSTARAVTRIAPGLLQGARAGLGPVDRSGSPGSAPSSEEWVVVEPEADIAPKSHPYISFDPDGTYP